jgi:hypothetical protein
MLSVDPSARKASSASALCICERKVARDEIEIAVRFPIERIGLQRQRREAAQEARLLEPLGESRGTELVAEVVEIKHRAVRVLRRACNPAEATENIERSMPERSIVNCRQSVVSVKSVPMAGRRGDESG